MKQLFLIVFLFILVIGFNACNNNEPTQVDNNIQISVNYKYENNAFLLFNDYFNEFEQRYRLSFFAFYTSNIALVSENNDTVLIKDVELWNKAKTNQNILANLPEGNYTQIIFGVGVSPALNNTDPNSYPAGHPLNVSQNTHWNWQQGYRFLNIEGSIDTTQQGDLFAKSILYHVGDNTIYQPVAYPINVKITNTITNQIQLNINVPKVFDNIEMMTYNQTQVLNNLAQTLMINFVSAISIQ